MARVEPAQGRPNHLILSTERIEHLTTGSSSRIRFVRVHILSLVLAVLSVRCVTVLGTASARHRGELNCTVF